MQNEIVEETTNIMQNFGENMEEITGMNGRTQEIHAKLSALGDMNDQVAEQTRGAVDDIGKNVTETVSHTENAVSVMEQSVRLTEAGMESIRQQSDEIAKGMEQVNVNTKENYGAIEYVTAATQENTAGVEEIERMVERITELAHQAVEN